MKKTVYMSIIFKFDPALLFRVVIFTICSCFHPELTAQDVRGADTTQAFQTPALSWQIGKMFILSGQVGVRLEYIANERFAENDTTASDDHRFRERVRLRFGGEIKPSDWFEAGFRISTGQATYPASGWSSFSDAFIRDAIALDRIYINVNYKKFQLRIGANANPLFHPTEMVWDEDVQPAGFAQIFRPGRWEIALGQFMLVEYRNLNPSELSGSFLFANGVAFSPEVEGNLKIGVFQYFYNKPGVIAYGIADGRLDGDFKTNRLDPEDEEKFFSNYNSIGTDVQWIKNRWQLSGEFAVNLGAKKDPGFGEGYAKREDVAFGFLIRYGILDKAGDWSLESGFFHIEADAVIAAFNSDDYQQTNINSVPIWLRVRLNRNTTLIWDTYFQKRINTALFLSGGIQHNENALKTRTRLTLQLGF